MLKRVVTWVAEVVRQLPCLIAGHNGKREGQPQEIFLRCTRCQRRSPGWQLPPAPRLIRPTQVARPCTCGASTYTYRIVNVTPLGEYLDQETPVGPIPQLIGWVVHDEQQARILH